MTTTGSQKYRYIRALSFIFLISFVFSIAGYRIIFSFVTQILHYKNWKKDHKVSVSLIFTDTQFHNLNWHEKQKEFEYSGEFYDVIKVKRKKDLFMVECYHDKHEKNILVFLLHCIKNTMDGSAGKGANSKSKINFKFPDYFAEGKSGLIPISKATEFSNPAVAPDCSGYIVVFLKPPIG